jgi:hypothetical protein
MSLGILVILFFIWLPAILVGWDFMALLLTGERVLGKWGLAMEIIVMTVAIGYLVIDTLENNSCCNASAAFSPEHRLSIIVLVSLCLAAYFYSMFRRSISPPLVEVTINCLLLAGVILNVFIAIQVGDWQEWLLGNVPVIMALILTLVKNHRLALAVIEDMEVGSCGRERGDEKGDGNGTLELFCRGVLYLRPLYKFPILLILCLPILVVLAGLLLLFGQKPDSFIRVFTDTYKHGLSQWDHQCEGVICGGHFLCTIAAKGHGRVVRPIRSGVRGGRKIVCNRQLLVSNAFEELLEQRLPALHRPIRKLYNRVGRQIHRHYEWFNHKWVSDSIYIPMKPLEWFFLLVLYTFDRRPEDRIAQQYLEAADRQSLRLATGLPL